ncbi:MAG: spore coat associated protein CotJA [Oscillospiraceae bacterium]|nr:spore coat associated protein CotJA [Oscillospiraceae bacterium]
MELHAFEKMAAAAQERPEERPMMRPQPMGVFPDVTPPGMAYVPFQQWGDVYEAEQGMQQGTMFPVLDMPFCMGGERG